ncbi:MAG: hypothetical protein EA404_10305 [Spirochaetaceae bacterium]|nr:MAG: hypothetical protein EA404_10305 [Spirochaetaceae bacterium]
MRPRKPKPPNRLRQQLSASHLFLTGGLLLPAYLLQPSLYVRIGQVLLFSGLVYLAGKRIMWLYFAIMVASITFFNLLTPIGRVVLSIGPLQVTSVALRNGLMKGFTIVGLVFISLFSIRPDLRLPGKLGGLVARVFFYFERIIEGKKRIEARRLIGSIDDVLTELYVPGQQKSEAVVQQVPTTVLGYALMGTLIGLNWLLLFI